MDSIRAYTLQLYKEYDHLCFTYQYKLKKPIIKVTELGSRWGNWDSEIRTISISLALIEKHSWDTVIEVLKHEIAHQIVTEKYHEEEAHGALFKSVCITLGMADWAVLSKGGLEEAWVNAKHQSRKEPEDNRMISRVQKLLSLATSSNEFEAEAAMKKVQELYARYQFEKGQSEESYDFITIYFKKKRVERYQSVICTLLNDFFFVDVIFSSLFDAEALCEFKTVEFLGKKENVKMAEYVFHFLERQLQSLWKNNELKKRRGVVARRSFYMGVLEGFREALEKNKTDIKKNMPKEKALILSDRDPNLSKFVKHRYPRLVKVSRGTRLQDGEAFDAGRVEGSRLKLHKPIHSQGMGILKFLK